MSVATREQLKQQCAQLKGQKVLLGTSSWKYPGWCGLIYDEARYQTRGKFSEKRFNDTCLTEYAETFPTVCVDAGYYKFPDERYLEKLVRAVPGDFLFAFKVTDTITLKHFPKLPRFGVHAGTDNEHFLSAELFRQSFLEPCAAFRANLGVLIFEFSQFYPRDFERGRDFVEVLDRFLAQVPKGWQYGVEIRNSNFLQPEYFETLRRHEVAHVFNSWSRMPPVSEQMKIDGSRTTDFVVARFLLSPGRAYEQAVKSFSPYKETRVVDAGARAAGRALIGKARQVSKRPSFIFVNNRLEGNSPLTIQAMLE